MMTDNNMPELTLASDTAAAAEIPALTLTPEAPATPATQPQSRPIIDACGNLHRHRENAVDAARIKSIGAYVFMASTIIPHISFTFIDL